MAMNNPPHFTFLLCILFILFFNFGFHSKDSMASSFNHTNPSIPVEPERELLHHKKPLKQGTIVV